MILYVLCRFITASEFYPNTDNKFIEQLLVEVALQRSPLSCRNINNLQLCTQLWHEVANEIITSHHDEATAILPEAIHTVLTSV